MNIAIYSQKRDEATLVYLRRFIEVLREKNMQIFVNENLKVLGDFIVFKNKTDLENYQVDYFFSFGGDGTMLNALNFIQNLEIPVVGVNLGRLGFLASFNQEEIFNQLDDVFSGKLKISPRSVIEVKTSAEIDFPYALNDVTITRKETASMVTVEAEISGEFLSFFWGDGLIVATPSGSTAYSLSCGGPIIEPENQNFSITPIAPHNLNMRPIIINDNVEIKLKVSSRVPQYSLGLDARLYHLAIEDELVLRKANFNFNIIFPKNVSFYETLRQKLLWGNDKRN